MDVGPGSSVSSAAHLSGATAGWGSSMRLYLRAMSYFRRDWRLLAVWGVLLGVSTIVGLLIAWPMAVLVDSVLSPHPPSDWVHKLFLAPLPSGTVGRIVGLAAIGLV